MSVAFDDHNFNYVNLESFDLYNVKKVKFHHQFSQSQQRHSFGG
jgi:hypothetical protein